jgi:predicted ABC-type ATPase
MPNLYIIAGCNGSGKTTASFTVLPEMLDCQEYINADEIARGLSPFNPDKSAIEAGKIMLNKINNFLKRQIDFSIETTLATRTYTNVIKKSRQLGYEITLVFFWLDSVELAKERVLTRVTEGGHGIPEATIARRYSAGLRNLFELYIPICDYWMIFNNSNPKIELIAEGNFDTNLKIENNHIFETLKRYKR